MTVSDRTVASALFVAATLLLMLCLGRLNAAQLSRSLPILTPALRFLKLSILAWLLAGVGSLRILNFSEGIRDQLWYWAVVLSCCGPISTLGARRPTSRVWTLFIILPLILVLGWPAVTAVYVRFPNPVALDIQFPVLMGFGLVLLMGCGNFLGTRYGLSVTLGGTAVSLNLVTVSQWCTEFAAPQLDTLRGISAVMYGLAILHGLRQSSREAISTGRFDDLWFDFRDAFGIVWSIRIQERINQTAHQEKWVARLGSHGMEWDAQATEEDRIRTEQRLEHTFRWLFRRFVEESWIESRLRPPHDAEQGQNHG